MVPGLDEAITDIEKKKVVAREIGFLFWLRPLLEEVEKECREWRGVWTQMKRAISEAINAFGDGAVLLRNT
jgi:propionyl-CoA carboxylase alpha chain